MAHTPNRCSLDLDTSLREMTRSTILMVLKRVCGRSLNLRWASTRVSTRLERRESPISRSVRGSVL